MTRRVLDESDSDFDVLPRSKPAAKAKETPVKKEVAKSASKKAKETPVKPKESSSKSKDAEKATPKKEAPVKFSKTGQKKETPAELDVLRMFYESAYKENPSSEMAARWCVMYGLLDEAVAAKLVNSNFKLNNPNKLKPTQQATKTVKAEPKTASKTEVKTETKKVTKEEPPKRKAEDTKLAPTPKKPKSRTLDDSDSE